MSWRLAGKYPYTVVAIRKDLAFEEVSDKALGLSMIAPGMTCHPIPSDYPTSSRLCGPSAYETYAEESPTPYLAPKSQLVSKL
jgi:hypothetical protein